MSNDKSPTKIYENAVKSFNGDSVNRKQIYAKICEMEPAWVLEKEASAPRKGQIEAEIGSTLFNAPNGSRVGFPVTKPIKGEKVNGKRTTITVCYDPAHLGSDIEELTHVTEPVIQNYNRTEVSKLGKANLSVLEQARYTAIVTISKLINSTGLSVDVDHANSLAEYREGAEHPDNLHILAMAKNRKKNSKSCKRFTWEEQVNHITYETDMCNRLGMDIDKQTVLLYLNMLKDVY